MNSVSYYSAPDTLCVHPSNRDSIAKTINYCSKKSNEYPVVVNCAGVVNASWKFTTYNPSGRDDYYYMYITEGALEISFMGGTRTVTRGNAIIFPPRYAYKYSNVTDKKVQYLWIHFTGLYVDSYVEKFGFGSMPCILPIGMSNNIEYKFQKIFDAYIENASLRDFILANECESILLSSACRFGFENKPHANPVFASVSFINSNYNTHITINQLAKIDNVSTSRYYVLFNNIIGTSPKNYIINIRLDTACDLLCDTELSISEISEIVGYEDYTFFSRLFKKHKGISPLKFRNNYRQR